MVSNVCSVVFLSIGLVVAVLGIVLGWAVFPGLVKKGIIKSVLLEEGSEGYERWEEVPFGIDFKVYFFHVENPQEVIAGGTPVLTERGPYIYKQFRRKYDIKKINDTWEYYQQQKYEFDEEKSYPNKETDSIDILNVPMNAVLQIVEKMSPALLLTINPLIKEVFLGNNQIIMTTTVEKLAFKGIKLCEGGKPSIVCNEIRKQQPKTMRIDEDGSFYISMFNHKNTTHDGRYLVENGKNDIADLGKIIEWEYLSTLEMWKGGVNSTCNMINGTDNTIYAPFLERETDLQIFNSDICRSVTTRYVEDVEYKGVSAYRYVAINETLAAPSDENNTMCFCLKDTIGITQPNGCLLQGAMELYPCFDSHVVLTYPHLLDADEQYQSGVIGMTPNKSLHEIFLEIEPNTGTPLRGGKRAQFNMFIRKLPFITTTKNLKTTLLPFIWVDEGIELPDEFIDYLHKSYFNVLLILEIVKWVLIGVGGLMLIIFTMILLFNKITATKTV